MFCCTSICWKLMNKPLWTELNDYQAEKATGGGLGNTTFIDQNGNQVRLVDNFLEARDVVQALGFKNLNEASRTLLDSNVGQVVSTVAQTGLPPAFLSQP